jgi:hypothetical protein
MVQAGENRRRVWVIGGMIEAGDNRRGVGGIGGMIQWGVQHSVEDRENGDLGAVAHYSGVLEQL